MAETTTSQAQHAPAQAQQSKATWNDLVEDQVKRLTTISEEVGRLEARSAERATTALAEAAQIGKESVESAVRLSSEWRKLWLDTARRSADLVQRGFFGGFSA